VTWETEALTSAGGSVVIPHPSLWTVPYSFVRRAGSGMCPYLQDCSGPR